MQSCVKLNGSDNGELLARLKVSFDRCDEMFRVYADGHENI